MSDAEDTMRALNLATLRHEAETPMRGHDPDGACCVLARLAATATIAATTLAEGTLTGTTAPDHARADCHVLWDDGTGNTDACPTHGARVTERRAERAAAAARTARAAAAFVKPNPAPAGPPLTLSCDEAHPGHDTFHGPGAQHPPRPADPR